MHDQLTYLQAFKAMQKFLEDYYEKTSSDDVGALLGGMQLLADGSTTDDAAWQDWLNSVKAALQEEQQKI